MFYTYVLKLARTRKLYVGFSGDLQARFAQHNRGLVSSTKRAVPWKLVYYEAYCAKEDAMAREKQLKRFAKGFSMLKGRIRSSLARSG